MRVLLSSIALIAASIVPPAHAQEISQLNDYTCAQFVADAQQTSDSAKSLKSLMMIYWATGYAAAFQTKAPRADASAVVLIAGVLSEECRSVPDERAVAAIVNAAARFAAGTPPGAKDNPQTDAQQVETKPSTQVEKLPALASATRQGPFDAYNNYDISGGDFRTIKNTGLPACVSACQSNNQCQAFSYDKWSKWCFLKRKVSAVIFEPSSILGVRSGSSITQSKSAVTVDVRHNKAFSGTELTAKQSVDFDECKRSCSDDDRCLGFSIVKASGKCRLFSDPQSFYTEVGTDSGVKHQNE